MQRWRNKGVILKEYKILHRCGMVKNPYPYIFLHEKDLLFEGDVDSFTCRCDKCRQYILWKSSTEEDFIIVGPDGHPYRMSTLKILRMGLRGGVVFVGSGSVTILEII